MTERLRVHLTPEGVEELRLELHQLIGVRRPQLAERLHRAIQQGDLSENADYITAKEEQGFLEGRIAQIETMLRYAVLIHSNGSSDCIAMGSRVTVVEQGVDEPEVFHIVGPAEADPSRGKVSHVSPLGRALLGGAVGDIVRVAAPAGEIAFRVIAVE